MKVTYANRSRLTGHRLERQMPEELEDAKIVLNLGNSDFDETPYLDKGYAFINRTREIANCVNKKAMFEVLTHAGVPCLNYYNLERMEDLIKALTDTNAGESLILRSSAYRDYCLIDSPWDFQDRPRHYTYATQLEQKIKEWRIIVFKDRLFRDWEKIPETPNQLYWHKENCVFEKVRYDNTIAESLALQAARTMDMALCGVDILENNLHEFKVIEVNSAMSLSEVGVMRLYRLLCREGKDLD